MILSLPFLQGKAVGKFQNPAKFLGSKATGTCLPVHKIRQVHLQAEVKHIRFGGRCQQLVLRPALRQFHHLLQRPCRLPAHQVGAHRHGPYAEGIRQGEELSVNRISLQHRIHEIFLFHGTLPLRKRKTLYRMPHRRGLHKGEQINAYLPIIIRQLNTFRFSPVNRRQIDAPLFHQPGAEGNPFRRIMIAGYGKHRLSPVCKLREKPVQHLYGFRRRHRLVVNVSRNEHRVYMFTLRNM